MQIVSMYSASTAWCTHENLVETIGVADVAVKGRLSILKHAAEDSSKKKNSTKQSIYCLNDYEMNHIRGKAKSMRI